MRRRTSWAAAQSGRAHEQQAGRGHARVRGSRPAGRSRSFLLGLVACIAIACSDDGAPAGSPASATTGSTSNGAAATTTAEASGADLVKEGWKTYRQTCSACHNLDPALDGPLGPAITGASLELLEARVLRAEYPPGHTPKRDTKAMVPLPHLEPKLPALHAYLNQ